MSGIEFLDEVADRTGDLPPESRRRSRWLVAGVVLTVVAMFWVLTRPVEHERAVPETRPTHAPLATSSPVAPEELICREEPNCRRSVSVPLVLRGVIDRYQRGTESITARSYLTRSLFDGATYLVARRIDVAAGPAALAILVRRDVQAGLALRPLVTVPTGMGSVLIRGDRLGYVIDLQYIAPPSVVQPLARLRALAIEPGLESL
jgi:hypothetical protein